MEESKTITTISIAPAVLKTSQGLMNYHGFRSFSHLVESLLVKWLNGCSPDWLEGVNPNASDSKEEK